jgi:hypothetical protein
MKWRGRGSEFEHKKHLPKLRQIEGTFFGLDGKCSMSKDIME